MKRQLYKIKSYLMRGGTSKGLFFKNSDLPNDKTLMNKILLSAIGSPDPYKKQIDGLGGATSSTSKIVLVDKPKINQQQYDVSFTFGHVAIDKPYIDYSGNCGNLTAAVGIFALEERLINPKNIVKNGITRIKVWQENLQKPLELLVPTNDEGEAENMGDFKIAGITNPGPEIIINFLEVGGGKNLEVFPTNNPVDTLDLPELKDFFISRRSEKQNEQSMSTIEATLVNAGNPTIFVKAESLGMTGKELPSEIDKDKKLMEALELIRCTGAVRMGMAESISVVKQKLLATPKISIVSRPQQYVATSGKQIKSDDIDVCARIISMGKAHHAYTGTGSIAASVAGAIDNTTVSQCRLPRQNKSQGITKMIRLGHPAGITDVGANVKYINNKYIGVSATFQRSARVLMKGEVYIPIYNQKQ